MKVIKLTQGKETIVDDDDYVRVSKYKWHFLKAGKGYAKRCIQKKIGFRKYRVTTVLLHRFIMNPPENMEIDHINRNPLDNRKSNLRLATRLDNLMNRDLPKHNKKHDKSPKGGVI